MDIVDEWNKFKVKMPLEGPNFVVNYFDQNGTTHITFIYDYRSNLMSDENYKKKHRVLNNIDIEKMFKHLSFEGWLMVIIKVEKKDLNALYKLLQILDEAYDIMYDGDYREMKTMFKYYCKEGEEYVKNNPDGGDRRIY